MFVHIHRDQRVVEILDYDKDIYFSYYLRIKTFSRINGLYLTIKVERYFCLSAASSNLGVRAAALSMSLQKVLCTDGMGSLIQGSKMSVRSVTSPHTPPCRFIKIRIPGY